MKQLCIICGVLLLLGIPTGWPYSYYQLLRIVICIASVLTAYKFYESKFTGWSIVFGAIALLFNPLFPVYLAKASWVSIDFISAILFFLAAFSVKSEK